jgi:hypothetical protein
MIRLRSNFLFSLGCAVSFFSLSGCSTPQQSTAQKATGITGTLSKLPGSPLWNIESVGPVNNAWEKKAFDLPTHGKIAIIGWAVDQQAKAAAGGVEIAIDGTPFAAQYGKPRPDVAGAYQVPSYGNAGYSLELSAETFAPGSHTAFVRVLSSDRKGFWEVGPYSLNFQ